MRWAREQQRGFLKLLPLLLLSIACTLAQHTRDTPPTTATTCPVSPFHLLERPTSCAAGDGTPNTSIVNDDNTSFKVSDTACTTSTDATSDATPSQGDRTPTAVSTTPAESLSTSSTVNSTEAIPISSASAPVSTSTSTKEDVWTEIDDSLGQSWTPELEAEYAKAQRDFELHTQAAAESSLASPSPEIVKLDIDAPLPEFPSFAEWKERHFAASIAAGKDTKKDGKDQYSGKVKSDSKNKSEDANSRQDSEVLNNNELPPAGSLDDLLREQAEPASSDEEQETSLTFQKQRIFHPVPHAGTCDPLLDPLISLRDRTNYASFDCSATLIRSSKSTKFASAILSSKKDRYMLTPCAQKEKYVIVELCDEIQIDTIVLANLEFFSSMFKLFRVSGGTAYPESAGTWHDIGTFRASNARGMQVFRPPEPARGGFYRYLRIDFLSHYGSEYYCPVSLLKVYGLTQLDAYRRDEERQSRLASADEQDLFAQMDPIQRTVQEDPVYLQLVEPVKMEPRIEQAEFETPSETAHIVSSTPPESHSTGDPARVSESTSRTWSVSLTVPPSYAKTSLPSLSVKTDTSDSGPSESTSPAVEDIQDTLTSAKGSAKTPATSENPTPGPSSSSVASTSLSLASETSESTKASSLLSPSSSTGIAKPVETSSLPSSSNGADMPGQTHKSASSIVRSSSSPAAARSSGRASTSSPSLIYRTASNAPQQATASPARRNESKPQVVYTHGHHANYQPNESIYGTIMKRLLALEVNSTLSTTYFEEQSRMVWETFRRIEDRLSNMEKTRAKYDQLLRRVMLDLELHRARHEAQRTELSGQLSVLSREMVMEKRLGIAQLLALIVLMFFVVLTRGSPSSPILNLTHPRSATVNTSFPAPVKSRRPRSLRDEPLESFPSIDFRTLPSRDRRPIGSGSRGAVHTNGNGLLRNASVKRPYRTSNNMIKRPVTLLPLKKNGSDYAPNTSENLSSVGQPATSPLSSSAPRDSVMHTLATKRHSRAASPINGVDPVILGMSDNDLSSSTITLRGSTPPLYPAPPKTRRSPVETLRRKLKLMQPRRAASLDGTGVLEPPNGVTTTDTTSSTSSVLDRQKKLALGNVPYLRDRSETMTSMASEGDEGNSRAWLSTSEDSGDENENSTPPSLGSPSFSDLSKQSVRNSPSAYVPPSPDPSDAETPAAVYQDLPSTVSPGYGSI